MYIYICIHWLFDIFARFSRMFRTAAPSVFLSSARWRAGASLSIMGRMDLGVEKAQVDDVQFTSICGCNAMISQKRISIGRRIEYRRIYIFTYIYLDRSHTTSASSWRSESEVPVAFTPGTSGLFAEVTHKEPVERLAIFCGTCVNQDGRTLRRVPTRGDCSWIRLPVVSSAKTDPHYLWIYIYYMYVNRHVYIYIYIHIYIYMYTVYILYFADLITFFCERPPLDTHLFGVDRLINTNRLWGVLPWQHPMGHHSRTGSPASNGVTCDSK